jgi:hypothetical protein
MGETGFGSYLLRDFDARGVAPLSENKQFIIAHCFSMIRQQVRKLGF